MNGSFTSAHARIAAAVLTGFMAMAGSARASAVAGLPESLLERLPDLTEASPVLAHLPGTAVGSHANLRVVSAGRELSLDGPLDEGIADRAAVVLAKNPGIVFLRLSSDGGLVDEADALGRVVAAHGLSTSVTGDCSSACTLVYVRGYRRHLGPRGRLGFHGPYVLRSVDRATSVDASSERHAYIRAGLVPDFVARALSGAPETMWYPTRARLRAVGVVTDYSAPSAP